MILLPSRLYSQDLTSLDLFVRTVDTVGMYETVTVYKDCKGCNEYNLFNYLGVINDSNQLKTYKVATRIISFASNTKIRHEIIFLDMSEGCSYYYICDFFKQLPIRITERSLIYFGFEEIDMNKQYFEKVYNPPFGGSLVPEEVICR